MRVYEDERAPGTLDEITLYNRNSLEQVSSIQQEDPNNNYNVVRTESYLYNAYDDLTSVMITPGPGNAASATATYNFQTVQLANGSMFDELTSVVDPLQNTTVYGYDPAGTGNVVTVTDPMQRVWRYTYYPNGEVATATDPKQNPPTQYTYTAGGDLQTVTDPLGHVTTFGYTGDQLGRVTSVTAPAGDITQYAYDALDDITSTTDPNGNVSSATYDLLGELASRTDPKGNTTTYTRPYTLNKLTVCDALNKCEVTDYDPSGNTSDFTDRNNLKTVIVYDKLRRITHYEYQTYIYTIPPYWSTTREANVTSYDALDRPLAVTDDGGGAGGGIGTAGNSINYTYDTVDNVMSEATAYTTGGYSGNVSYTYDKDSRPTSISETQNSQTAAYTYCYDNDSELVYVYSVVGASCGSGTPIATLGYDNDGNRSRLTVAASGSPVITGYGYDAASRLKSQAFSAGANNLGSLNYGYDLDSRVNSETGTLANITLPPSVSSITYTATN
jgi:YD repeat-containing protein